MSRIGRPDSFTVLWCRSEGHYFLADDRQFFAYEDAKSPPDGGEAVPGITPPAVMRPPNTVTNPSSSIREYLDAGMTVQTVLGQENHLFEPALAEAQMLYGRSSRIHDEFANDFDGLLSKCSQAAIANLAKPNIRATIYGVIRVLNRERTDLKGEMLIRLLMDVRRKLSA